MGTSGTDDCSIPGALLCSLADLPVACILEWRYSCGKGLLHHWPFSPTHTFYPLLESTLNFLGQWWAFVNIGSKKDLSVFFYTKCVYLLPRSLHLVGRIFFRGVVVLLLSTGNVLWSSLLCWGRARILWRISNVQCNWLDINIWVLNI